MVYILKRDGDPTKNDGSSNVPRIATVDSPPSRCFFPSPAAILLHCTLRQLVDPLIWSLESVAQFPSGRVVRTPVSVTVNNPLIMVCKDLDFPYSSCRSYIHHTWWLVGVYQTTNGCSEFPMIIFCIKFRWFGRMPLPWNSGQITLSIVDLMRQPWATGRLLRQIWCTANKTSMPCWPVSRLGSSSPHFQTSLAQRWEPY